MRAFLVSGATGAEVWWESGSVFITVTGLSLALTIAHVKLTIGHTACKWKLYLHLRCCEAKTPGLSRNTEPFNCPCEYGYGKSPLEVIVYTQTPTTQTGTVLSVLTW